MQYAIFLPDAIFTGEGEDTKILVAFVRGWFGDPNNRPLPDTCERVENLPELLLGKRPSLVFPVPQCLKKAVVPGVDSRFLLRALPLRKRHFREEVRRS